MLLYKAYENVILKNYKLDDNLQINLALYNRLLFLVGKLTALLWVRLHLIRKDMGKEEFVL